MIAHLDTAPRAIPMDRNQLADEQLMRQAQRGDEEAFAILYGRYRVSVVAYLNRLLGRGDDCEGVAQDVFVRAFRFAGTYRYPHKFSSWLFAIARNLASNTLSDRRRKAARCATDLNAPLEAMAGMQAKSGDPLERQEIVAKLMRAVDKLPMHQKQVLVLGFLEDMSYAQIEEITGVKAVTLRSHMFQAMKRLERRLRPTCA